VLGERPVPADAQLRHHPAGLIESASRDLEAVLGDLYGRGIRRVFVEGGPTIASAFVESGLVDEYLIYLAPTIIGGPKVAIGDIGVGTIGEQRHLTITSVDTLRDDILITARPGAN
jgi:diaminohydroxyphosphoribosylaminopyrimidine deaminase/5-amino-6-(5-phosphoribosylamino)uracil reductase